MLIALIGIIIGVFVGLNLPFNFSSAVSLYLSVGILAAMDSIVGALKGSMENRFDTLIFISGFVVNALMAFFLSYIGDMLGVPLYYAAIFVFGTRLFQNIGIIRRMFIDQMRGHSEE